MQEMAAGCDIVLMRRVGSASQSAIRRAELNAVAQSGRLAAISESLVTLLMACEPHFAGCARLRDTAYAAANSLAPAYREALAEWMQARGEGSE